MLETRIAKSAPLLVILILVLLRLHGGLRNTVQVTLATLGDAPAALVLIVLQHANLLQRLHHLAVDRARGVDVVRGTGAAVLGAAVDLAHAADTDRLPQVNVAGDGSGADVEPGVRERCTIALQVTFVYLPVNALRRQLFGVASLDSIAPTCRLMSAYMRQHQVPRPTRVSGFSCPFVAHVALRPSLSVGGWVWCAHGPGIGNLPWRFKKAA